MRPRGAGEYPARDRTRQRFALARERGLAVAKLREKHRGFVRHFHHHTEQIARQTILDRDVAAGLNDHADSTAQADEAVLAHDHRLPRFGAKPFETRSIPIDREPAIRCLVVAGDVEHADTVGAAHGQRIG